MLQGFRTLKPTAQVTRYVDLWERLWDDEYVAAYQAMTAWSDRHELRLDAGHIGLVVGKTAARTTVPTIMDVMQQRSEVRMLRGCGSSGVSDGGRVSRVQMPPHPRSPRPAPPRDSSGRGRRSMAVVLPKRQLITR